MTMWRAEREGYKEGCKHNFLVVRLWALHFRIQGSVTLRRFQCSTREVCKADAFLRPFSCSYFVMRFD